MKASRNCLDAQDAERQKTPAFYQSPAKGKCLISVHKGLPGTACMNSRFINIRGHKGATQLKIVRLQLTYNSAKNYSNFVEPASSM